MEERNFSSFIIWGGVIVGTVAAVIFLSQPKSNLFVNSVSGKAQLSRSGQTLYLLAGEPLFKGDKIVVTEGSVDLYLDTEQSRIKIETGSTLHVNYDAAAKSLDKNFKVSSGLVKFFVQTQSEGQSLRVDTETTSITGSNVDFAVTSDGENSTVAVTKGKANITHNLSNDYILLEEKYIAEFSGNRFGSINSIGKTSLPKVLNYTVMNPETNELIEKYGALGNDAQISINDLAESGYNLRANIANTSIIKHVRFTLTDNAGRKIHSSSEAMPPYALAGMKSRSYNKGDYEFNAFESKPGTYILTVDVFTPKSVAPVYSSKFKYNLR